MNEVIIPWDFIGLLAVVLVAVIGLFYGDISLGDFYDHDQTFGH